MSPMRFQAWFTAACVLTSCVLGGAVRAGANPDQILLAATFNDRTLNTQIGTGGAAVGEPVSISESLQAVVIPAGLFASPSLRMRTTAGSATRLVRFEFLDSAEITGGELRIGFVLKPSQLDRFLVAVREQGTAGSGFLNLVLLDTGQIAVADAADPAGALIGTYAAGDTLVFELHFHMDTQSYDIYRNGQVLAAARHHGITSRGVGALLLGMDNQSTVGVDWFVEDVYAYLPDQFLADGFED